MTKLQVIQGGAQLLPLWLSFPASIDACCPSDQSTIGRVRVSPERALRAAAARRRQPAFELWSMILGDAPPINNVNYPGNQPHKLGLTKLVGAHACFHGLKRPVAADERGDSMLTFVLKPSFYYRFDNCYAGAMVCVARRLPVPEDLLFMAHVTMDQPISQTDQSMIGCLTHWGFVQRSGTNPRLPVDFETRFNGQHW